mgnify:CR=1 FL=1
MGAGIAAGAVFLAARTERRRDAAAAAAQEDVASTGATWVHATSVTKSVERALRTPARPEASTPRRTRVRHPVVGSRTIVSSSVSAL